MTKADLALEAINSLDGLIGALDSLIDDQFGRIVQIEVVNGSVASDGHMTEPGVPYFFCAFNGVQHNSQVDYVVVDEKSTGKQVGMAPPDERVHIGPGQGFATAVETRGGWGVNYMVPVVLCPLWLGSTKPLPGGNTPVPSAVAAKLPNPVPFYVWMAFGGMFSPSYWVAEIVSLSLISYSISPVNYTPSSNPPSAVQTMLDTVWDQVNNNGCTKDHDSDKITPNSDYVSALGKNSGGSPVSMGFIPAVASDGTECFLDDDGNPCNPYVKAVSTVDKVNQMNLVRVEFSNSVS